MPFKSLGLSDPLVQGILATGYTAPTKIQSQAIPLAVEGKDVIGCAQTGTGKTAAFVLPILNRLCADTSGKKKVVKALILTPTRELAVQIEQAILGYGRFTRIHSLAIYGGVSIENQIKALRRGIDIVVATPGRLMDHMDRRTIDLRNVEVLVLDEADRMFDMGFINDVKHIISVLPQKRQTLLFSATMSPEVRKLAAGVQQSPKLIQVGEQRNPIETITQHIYPIQKELKNNLLVHMIKEGQMNCVLVFSRTKHGADKICRRLEVAGINAVSLHSDRTQSQRQRALDGFKSGKHQVMVATDIAARGIDVDGISHVINFDVPAFAEDYIHRIGRTGRAGETGDAITLVSRDEEKHIKQIERFINRRFQMEKYPGFDYAQPQPQSHQQNSPREREHAPREQHQRQPGRFGRPSTSAHAPKKAWGSSNKPRANNRNRWKKSKP